MAVKRVIVHYMHEVERDAALQVVKDPHPTDSFVMGTLDDAQIKTLRGPWARRPGPRGEQAPCVRAGGGTRGRTARGRRSGDDGPLRGDEITVEGGGNFDVLDAQPIPGPVGFGPPVGLAPQPPSSFVVSIDGPLLEELAGAARGDGRPARRTGRGQLVHRGGDGEPGERPAGSRLRHGPRGLWLRRDARDGRRSGRVARPAAAARDLGPVAPPGRGSTGGRAGADGPEPVHLGLGRAQGPDRHPGRRPGHRRDRRPARRRPDGGVRPAGADERHRPGAARRRWRHPGDHDRARRQRPDRRGGGHRDRRDPPRLRRPDPRDAGARAPERHERPERPRDARRGLDPG